MDAEPRKKMAAFVVVNLANEGGLNKQWQYNKRCIELYRYVIDKITITTMLLSSHFI
jgi:hypothetical protein